MVLKKDPAAVKLGRKGGRAKVPKGAQLLPPERRSEIAKKAAEARWKDTRPTMSQSDLYETDFVEWTRENAARLRSGAPEEADLMHIAEEIEDLGKNWQRALESRLRQLVLHLLKVQYQSSHPNRRRWQISILNQRIKVADLLKKAPSLHPQLVAALSEVYPDARALAIAETGLAANTFPLECPWKVDEILDRDFLST